MAGGVLAVILGAGVVGARSCGSAVAYGRAVPVRARSALSMAGDAGNEPSSRLLLVSKVFSALDSDGDGRVDRSEMYAFTHGKSAAFGKYARALFNALDANDNDVISIDELRQASDAELQILATPMILEAFQALDSRKCGRLSSDDVSRILAAKRLENATRADARPLLERLLAASADQSIGVEQLMRLSLEQLRLLERTGREAARTGYIPPEQMQTPIDDSWERRVISEIRAGGMTCGQADILRTAIKWNR